MAAMIKIYPNQYYDSVQLLFITSSLKKMEGVETAYVAMGTEANKEVFTEIGMDADALKKAGPNDMVIGVKATDDAACEHIISEVQTMLTSSESTEEEKRYTYTSIASAMEADKKANLCIISVPSAYVKTEACKALNAGLNVLIFSDNVPLEEEREIKLLATENGLLCMGPDCGVTNINGISFLVGSIVRKGPIGICAASGVGLQEVATLIHNAGSGVSQGIGTGGKDLKDKVGGLTMLSGIDSLERDQETKVIVLISRKPENNTLEKVLNRVSDCKKPVVICFMGCESDIVEKAGAVYALNLEEAASCALDLVGIAPPPANIGKIDELAEAEAAQLSKEQKYVRGLFCGGTFVEEAMVVMRKSIGDIYSNAPLSAGLKLASSTISVKNSVVDYGDEEFTVDRPHPVIDTEPRGLGILREAQDPETAVLLLDFILGPAVNTDPVGSVLGYIKQAMKIVADRGGKLVIVASVCGTEDDPQRLSLQEKMLSEAGVIVCTDNYQASLLAGEIIRKKAGGIINAE